MRKAILSGVGTVAMAAGLTGCGSGGTSTGAGMMSSVGGTSSHQSAATGGGGPTAAATGTTGGSGSTTGTAASGGCKPQTFISFCEKIAITGAVTVNGTGAAIPEFDQDGGGLTQKCATWPTYQPKNPDDHDLTLPTDPVDGHKLLMIWPFAAGVGASDITKYAGTNSISVDGAGFQVVAVDVNNTTASSGSVQVNADGSGTLSFKDLAGESGKISGTISWTCVDSQ